MPNKANEIEFSTEQWPGLPDPANPEYAMYTEQLLVGYRFYEEHAIAFTTGFPFGHGLSYTTFKYSQMTVDTTASPYTVTFDLANTGSVAGSEIVQLYLGFPDFAGEPPIQLKGFKKVTLNSGEKTTVTLDVTPRDVSIWDAVKHAFVVVSGQFAVKVGSSSRDLRLTGNMMVK